MDITNKATPRRKKGYSPNEISPKANAIISTIMTLLTVIFIIPVLLVIIVSFSTPESLLKNGYTLFPNSSSLIRFRRADRSFSPIR